MLENELKRIKPSSAVGLMYSEIVRLTLALVMGLSVIYELPPNKGVVILIPIQNKRHTLILHFSTMINMFALTFFTYSSSSS